jgi:hypothetical protein
VSLFKELKRRNVFCVGTACLVASWLIIRLVETIFPAFGFGDAADLPGLSAQRLVIKSHAG